MLYKVNLYFSFYYTLTIFFTNKSKDFGMFNIFDKTNLHFSSFFIFFDLSNEKKATFICDYIHKNVVFQCYCFDSTALARASWEHLLLRLHFVFTFQSYRTYCLIESWKFFQSHLYFSFALLSLKLIIFAHNSGKICYKTVALYSGKIHYIRCV